MRNKPPVWPTVRLVLINRFILANICIDGMTYLFFPCGLKEKTPRRTVISRGRLTWSAEDMDQDQASTPKKKRLSRMNSQEEMTAQIKGDNREGQKTDWFAPLIVGRGWEGRFWWTTSLVSVCPSKRWSHTMCLSDPDTAVLIGGETMDQNYCKDSLWKLELGRWAWLTYLAHTMFIDHYPRPPARWKQMRSQWLESCKAAQRWTNSPCFPFMTCSQTVTSGSPWTPPPLDPCRPALEGTLPPLTRTLNPSLFTEAWGRLSATASSTSSTLWRGTGRLSLCVCCKLECHV